MARAALGRRIGHGRCPCCGHRTLIVPIGPSAREQRVCLRCRANARNRALIAVLGEAVPDWRGGVVFEPSPTGPLSRHLQAHARTYIGSVFRGSEPRGAVIDGLRNEDLEHLALDSESVDLVVTQDVLEHVFDPEAATKEIARVLRPGGSHVFTVPVRPDQQETISRARVDERGTLVELLPAEYHEDPFDPDAGALVVTDWGADTAERIDGWSATTTVRRRLRAPETSKDDLVDVFVSRRIASAAGTPTSRAPSLS